MGPLDADTVRASLLYLVVIALSGPLWVVLLFPGRYEQYLLSPALVVLIVVGWLAVTLGFVIGNYLGCDLTVEIAGPLSTTSVESATYRHREPTASTQRTRSAVQSRDR